jgi:SAM-dependent methyltransferase
VNDRHPDVRPGAHVSDEWAQWRATVDLDEYESRFVHADAHGEADAIESFGPASALDAGCGTGRVAIELHRRGIDVVGVDLDDDLLALARRKAPSVPWIRADLSSMSLGRTFDVVAMPGNVMLYCRPEHRAAVVASCAAHLAPDGLLVAGFALRSGGVTLDEYDAAAAGAGLVLAHRWGGWGRERFVDGDYAVSIHRLGSVG